MLDAAVATSDAGRGLVALHYEGKTELVVRAMRKGSACRLSFSG